MQLSFTQKNTLQRLRIEEGILEMDVDTKRLQLTLESLHKKSLVTLQTFKDKDEAGEPLAYLPEWRLTPLGFKELREMDEREKK